MKYVGKYLVDADTKACFKVLERFRWKNKTQYICGSKDVRSELCCALRIYKGKCRSPRLKEKYKCTRGYFCGPRECFNRCTLVPKLLGMIEAGM